MGKKCEVTKFKGVAREVFVPELNQTMAEAQKKTMPPGFVHLFCLVVSSTSRRNMGIWSQKTKRKSNFSGEKPRNRTEQTNVFILGYTWDSPRSPLKNIRTQYLMGLEAEGGRMGEGEGPGKSGEQLQLRTMELAGKSASRGQ